MNFAVFYLVRHFVFHIVEFFTHWYINTAIVITRWLIENLESFDRTLALRVTIKHLFQPLYGDYSIIGHIVGPIFRIARVGIALLVYPALIISALIAYLIWAAIPLFFIARIISPSFLDPQIDSILLWITR